MNIQVNDDMIEGVSALQNLLLHKAEDFFQEANIPRKERLSMFISAFGSCLASLLEGAPKSQVDVICHDISSYIQAIPDSMERVKNL